MNGIRNRKKIVNAFWMILIATASFSLGWILNGRTDIDSRLIKTTQKIILNDSFLNTQSGKELTYAAIRGMLSVIEDPYAELIEPEAAQDMLNTFRGNTGVVGLYAENQSGQVVVKMVFPEGAAQEAGIKVGDVILSIDGNVLDRYVDSSETGLLIRGTPGTSVELEILREDQVITFLLIRQEQKFVTSTMLPEKIAYITLSAFNDNASQKMKNALEGLLAEEPIGMIWDLRNNEGGDMQAAQEILSYFIEDGLLFSAQLTRDRSVEFPAKGEAFAANIPLVILIDETTYSAAETAAAAVSEMGRGITVGSTTYGKGLIQATVPLLEDTLLQMTIAKWLSASGEWYHERGVPADIEIRDDSTTEVDEVLQKGIEILLTTQ